MGTSDPDPEPRDKARQAIEILSRRGAMENEKDIIALQELSTIINRLTSIHEHGQKNVGKSRPIFSEVEISLVQDHLDLVKKYVRL